MIRQVGVLAAFTALAACVPAHHASTQSESAILRSEERDVDKTLAWVPRAKSLVDTYRIENEVLTVVVDASAWRQLGTQGQDNLKADLWRPWRDSFLRHHPDASVRVFLKVEDLQGNDLGSSF